MGSGNNALFLLPNSETGDQQGGRSPSQGRLIPL